MSIFGRLSKSNFHILFINLLIIFIAYNFMMDYLKNAPITHQEINGLKFTLIGGFKKKEEKFYFKLTIVNNTNSDTTIVLEKPMLKFIIEQTEKILYETDFSQDYNNADTAVLQLKKKKK